MPSIVVALGRIPTYITIEHPQTVELEPNTVFDSFNRVGDLAYDRERLAQAHPGLEVAQIMRRELDAAFAPSMSVGDELRYISDSGITIRRLECAPVGWDDLPIGGATDWRDQ